MVDFRSSDPYLQKRYGIKAKRGWVPVALFLLIVGVIWTIWSGGHHSQPEIRYNLITFKEIDERAISIRFTVEFKSKSKSHTCTLVARDFETNVVGEKLYEFPVGITAQDVTTSIPTRARAVNAGILGCEIR